MKRFALLSLMALSLAGCPPIQTHNEVVISGGKPLEMNMNVHVDTINIVISDARKDMQQMTGEAPAREVKLQDLGFPVPAPAKGPGAMLSPQLRGTAFPGGEDTGHKPGGTAALSNQAQVLTLAVVSSGAASSEEDLKNNISGRHPQVRYLLDAHVAGETHTGLLAAADGVALTAPQSAIMTAENADRAALYILVAQRKGSTVEEVGLSYYVARLGYAKPGDWYERFNATPKTWTWSKWPN